MQHRMYVDGSSIEPSELQQCVDTFSEAPLEAKKTVKKLEKRLQKCTDALGQLLTVFSRRILVENVPDYYSG